MSSTVSLKCHAERSGAWHSDRFNNLIQYAYFKFVRFSPDDKRALFSINGRGNQFQIFFMFYIGHEIHVNTNKIRVLNNNRFKIDINFYIPFRGITDLARRIFDNNIPNNDIQLTPINRV